MSDEGVKPRSARKLFTAKEFEQLQEAPRRIILESIQNHNLVQHRQTKPKTRYRFERAVALAAGSARVRIVPRKNKSGGSYFYTVRKGDRAKSTNIRIDIKPLPTPAEIRANPEWWKASKYAAKLQSKKRELERNLQSEHLRRAALNAQPIHVAVLRKALNRAGFSESHFVERLEGELGIDFLAQICRDCFMFVDREAEAYIRMKRVRLGDDEVLLPYGRPLLGEYRLAPEWDDTLKALARPLNHPNRRKQNANTKL